MINLETLPDKSWGWKLKIGFKRDLHVAAPSERQSQKIQLEMFIVCAPSDNVTQPVPSMQSLIQAEHRLRSELVEHARVRVLACDRLTRSHSLARVGKKWTLLCVLTPASLPQQIKTCLSLSGCLSPADPIHQHYKGAQAASRSAQFPPAVMKYQNRSERGHPHTCKEMI